MFRATDAPRKVFASALCSKSSPQPLSGTAAPGSRSAKNNSTNRLPYLLSEIARKNGCKVEARSWLPVGLSRDTYFGISLTSQEE